MPLLKKAWHISFIKELLVTKYHVTGFGECFFGKIAGREVEMFSELCILSDWAEILVRAIEEPFINDSCRGQNI